MRRSLFNLPNSVSLSRLLLALAFLFTNGIWDRCIIIGAAGITDFLDGWLARRGKITSRSGALIDPLADRVFVFTAVSTYLINGLLTTSQYFIFLSRDIATAVGFLVARLVPDLQPAVFQARMLGKIVTVVQLITLVVVLFESDWAAALVYTVGIISAASIIDYTLALWRARRRQPA